MMIDCDRFFIAMDMNGDALTTISDVWGWLQVVFFRPRQSGHAFNRRCAAIG